MNHVFVLMNVYNEAHNLSRSWASAQQVFGPKNVTLIAIDGRYPEFPGDSDFSTDGTEGIARADGYYLPVFDHECEKRTAGLGFIDSIAEPGDWVLYLDADETINRFSGFPEAPVGKFDFIRTSDKREYGRCRLYRHEPGMAFLGRHYDLYGASGQHRAGLATAPDYEVVGSGIHYDIYSPERIKARRAYHPLLRLREAAHV